MLEKIIKKDKNEELEKVLEEKMIDEQAKMIRRGEMIWKVKKHYSQKTTMIYS